MKKRKWLLLAVFLCAIIGIAGTTLCLYNVSLNPLAAYEKNEYSKEDFEVKK